MQNSSKFQYIVLIGFAVFAVVGFIIFATFSPTLKQDKDYVGQVIIWGSFSQSVMNQVLEIITASSAGNSSPFRDVTYVEISRESFNQDLLEAIASDSQPDLILVSNVNLLENFDKILPISGFTRRDFLNKYIDASEIFLSDSGVLAFPFLVDPLILYYNKNHLLNANIVFPPKTWAEVLDMTEKLKQVEEETDKIIRPAIALGEAYNINHFKEILATLFFQIQNPIVSQSQNSFYATLSGGDFQNVEPAIAFFTEFSDPNKKRYTWNRSLTTSKNMFLANNLSFYIGKASEILEIRKKNSNLSFDIAEIPKAKNTTRNSVYADLYGFAVLKKARNQNGAFKTALALSESQVLKKAQEVTNLPPVSKALLAGGSTENYMSILYREALYAQSFLDPSYFVTEKKFQDLIENVNSGRYTKSQALNNLNNELNILLSDAIK